MSHIAYFRVSQNGQSIESQKAALTNGHLVEKEFTDEGVSGAIIAAKRPGFAAMLDYVRAGDTLHVYAVDRLGRDAIDVQTNVNALLEKGVAVEINGLGQISKGAGEIVVAVLAQVAQMERIRIMERTAAGRAVAVASLAATGKTHKGKDSMGRPQKLDDAAVAKWREDNKASISQTAKHFEVSEATIKRCLNPATRKQVKAA